MGRNRQYEVGRGAQKCENSASPPQTWVIELSVNQINLTELLNQFMASLSVVNRIWVGFSGGVDSTALLKALQPLQQRWPIGVIHVNHQSSDDSDIWQQHCEQIALSWGFNPVICRSVVVNNKLGGFEQAARDARYCVFQEFVGQDDALLLAHHQEDQSETFLLRLIRGAGGKGLAAMKPLRTFGNGYLGRPFLGINKSDLQHFCRAHNCDWVEDSSNQSTRYDRNFLRLQVLPQLRQRWPNVDQQVANASLHLQQQQALLEDYFADDLVQLNVKSERLGQSLDGQRLATYSSVRAQSVLRHWLQIQGYQMPAAKQLHNLDDLLRAKADSVPLIEFADCQLRRFRQRVYCLPNNWTEAMLQAPVKLTEHFSSKVVPGRLRIVVAADLGFEIDGTEWLTSVALHGGLTRAHPSDRAHSQTLKKLMQEFDVPPWLRRHWPLVFRGDELICLPGLWVEKSFVKEKNPTNMDWLIDAQD